MRGMKTRLVGGLGDDLGALGRDRDHVGAAGADLGDVRERPCRGSGCRWRRRRPASTRRAARSGRASSRRPRRRRRGCRRSPSSSARPRGRPAGRCGGRGRGRSGPRSGCGRWRGSARRSRRASPRSCAGCAFISVISSAIRSGGSVPRACASQRPSRYIAATWLVKVFVAATPISSPARVNSTESASRVAWLPITLVRRDDVGAALAREPHRGQRVGGLARLRDPDDEVVRADHRVAVAELGGDVHLDRDPGPVLDRVAADEAGVVAGAAGDDDHAAQLGGALLGVVELAEIDGVDVREAVGDRLGDRVGLLVDLLHHEGRVAAPLGRLLVPGDLLDLALERRRRRRR